MLGKTFKGMTDAMLEWQTERLLDLEIGREEHAVHVRPELVVKITFDGVQVSPQYPGGWPCALPVSNDIGPTRMRQTPTRSRRFGRFIGETGCRSDAACDGLGGVGANRSRYSHRTDHPTTIHSY